ncbi:hypothetical protein ACHAXT_001845 [Thalassiosira profunda]
MNSIERTRSKDDCCKRGPLVRFVPRPLPSSAVVHRRKLLLALPPSTTGKIANIPDLIVDVVPRILSFCDARTLSRASCVSRAWSRMANANELWSELCKETFGVAPSELQPPPDPTRMLYVLSHLRLKEVARGWGGRGASEIQIISASAYRRFVF